VSSTTRRASAGTAALTSVGSAGRTVDIGPAAIVGGVIVAPGTNPTDSNTMAIAGSSDVTVWIWA